jgi:hypothetical protein
MIYYFFNKKKIFIFERRVFKREKILTNNIGFVKENV